MKALSHFWPKAEKRSAFVLVYTALALTLLEYAFHPPHVEGLLQGLSFGAVRPPSLQAGMIWASGTITLFLIVPAILMRLLYREPMASIGYHAAGFRRHALVYLLLFVVVMLPLVFFAASRPDFQRTYPFVREATYDLSSFLLWEAFYLTQFIALEAFFRGFLLFTLERVMGGLAVFVMTVPYCMIHYHKPPLEAVGAILAGIALGTLALRYRSWYGGALLHILVAATMDFLGAKAAGLF